MSASATVPTSDLDPFSVDLLIDPFDFHAELRDTAPVVYLTRYGLYAMARYEQVHGALRNWQDFESSAGVGLSNFRNETPWRPPSVLLEADPPQHDAPRHVLAGILAPRAIRALRARWQVTADDLVDRLLQGVPSGGTLAVDAVPALSQAFPLSVFPDAVGIGADGREKLLPYGNLAFNAFGPRNALLEAELPTMAGLSAWVNTQCARDALSDHGFGAAIWAAADRRDITHEQAPLVVRSLLTAGVDTTVLGIQAMLAAFCAFPDAWARVVQDPGLARTGFDEAVRWASPVQTFFRTATRDVDVSGTVVPQGEKILMFLGAANRDPRRWDDPDRFDLDRDPAGHVGFGFGLHQCVGQHVARLEAECLIGALAARVRTIEPAGDPIPHPNNTLRGWQAMPLRLTVA